MCGRGSGEESAVVDTAGRRHGALRFRTGILKGKRGASQGRPVCVIITVIVVGGGVRSGGIERRSVVARGAGSVHEADRKARIAGSGL